MSAPLGAERKSAMEVARIIVRTQGLKGFYAGMTPVLLRAFPVNAAAYSVYEGIMRLLQAEKVRQRRPTLLHVASLMTVYHSLCRPDSRTICTFFAPFVP